MLPDEEEALYQEMVRLADEEKVDVIFTTGEQDFRQEIIPRRQHSGLQLKNVPGIAEAIRAYSMQITPRAMLSRAVSVMRGQTLIINLPGGPKAVKESLEFLLPSLAHGIQIMKGEAGECARKG